MGGLRWRERGGSERERRGEEGGERREGRGRGGGGAKLGSNCSVQYRVRKQVRNAPPFTPHNNTHAHLHNLGRIAAVDGYIQAHYIQKCLWYPTQVRRIGEPDGPDVRLHNHHPVHGQGTRLIRADGGGAPHGLAGVQVAHQVVVLEHLLDGVGQGYGDGQGQTLRHRHHQHRDPYHEEVEEGSGVL